MMRTIEENKYKEIQKKLYIHLDGTKFIETNPEKLNENVLNDQFVRKILSIDKGPDALLISWSKDNKFTKIGDNIISNVTKIRVIAIVDGENEILSYIIKFNKKQTKDPYFEFRKYSMRKEVCFYEEILPQLNNVLLKTDLDPLRIPKCIYTSLENEKECIVLEDLTTQNFKMNHFSSGLSEEHLDLIVKELTRLHAAGYLLQKDGVNLQKYSCLKDEWLETGHELQKPFITLFESCLESISKLAKDINEECSRLIEAISNCSLDLLRNQITSYENKTICHGDPWNNNFLFRYNDEGNPVDVRLIDFQICRLSSPVTDLTYMFYTSIPTNEMRLKVKKQIIENYCTYFNCAMTKDPITFEQVDQLFVNNYSGLLLALVYVPIVLKRMQLEEFKNKGANSSTEKNTDIKHTCIDEAKTSSQLSLTLDNKYKKRILDLILEINPDLFSSFL